MGAREMRAETIRQPYADLEPRLTELVEEIILQACGLEDQAGRLELQAEYERTRAPREKINRLRDQAENLRYQCRVLDTAARICGSRGTAAETVGIGFVLPPGYVATPEWADPPAGDDSEGAADALRRTRRAMGLSVRAMGDALGVPFNTIGRWERGEMAILHPRLLRLALERYAEAAASH